MACVKRQLRSRWTARCRVAYLFPLTGRWSVADVLCACQLDGCNLTVSDEKCWFDPEYPVG